LRRLIINADDFGLTAGVNRGILEGHQNGVVSSTTVMACSQGFQDAATLPQRAPGLSVGCHVVLVDGQSTLNPSQIPTLMGRNDGWFREKLLTFACLAATGKLDAGQIEAEATAQIQKLQSAGIAVSHLDSHKHTHIFPVVVRGMLRAAQNCGIRAIRNPFEPLVFASLRHWKRQFQLRLLDRFRAGFRTALANAGVVTPDGCIGIAATGGVTLDTFERLIEGLPEGTWEFVSHPGYNDADLDKVKTRLRDCREKELAILTSPSVKDLLRREAIDLISYREL
jgi:hopanoid biosynthesis associated protein HpnK